MYYRALHHNNLSPFTLTAIYFKIVLKKLFFKESKWP